MSTTRVSPGLRAKLAALGYTPAQLGRTFNTAVDVDLTMPSTPAEFEQFLADGKKMEKMFLDPQARTEVFPQFLRSYAKTVLDKDTEIATQVREQTQVVLAQWLRDNAEEGATPRVPLNMGGASPTDVVMRGRQPKNTVYNPRAMGAAIDKEYTSSADFLRDIWHHGTKDVKTVARLDRVRNAFSSGVPADGGFLIPEVLRSELLRVSLETAVVRPRARVIPMESLTVPFPAIDSTSNVSSVYGGIVGYWTEEGAALTQSQAKFSRVVLNAKKLTAYTEVPNELIADSIISFQAFIDEIFPEALGFYEDVAFLTGSGVGEPKGVLSAPATVSVAAESGQPTATIVWENIVKMFARMLPASLNRAVWVVSPDTFPELATMALAVGAGGSAVWLNNGVGGPPMTILGRPVIVSEKASVLGTAGDISFIDFGMYLIGDRQVMSAQSSGEYKFGNDMTAYRIIERLDGRPWMESAVTPKNNGPTLSPFVQLATRP